MWHSDAHIFFNDYVSIQVILCVLIAFINPIKSRFAVKIMQFFKEKWYML